MQNPLPQIANFNLLIETKYISKTILALDKFFSEGCNTVLFDWDGTIRGNYLEHHVKNYIRQGFVEVYKYAKSKGAKIETCTLRMQSDVDNLEHLGITFDDYNGYDSMFNYINSNQSIFQKDAKKIALLPKENLEELVKNVTIEINKGNRPLGWEAVFQACAEILANQPDYPNIKNLYMAHRLSQGEMVLLVDDTEAGGGIAEKFGMGVLVPKPQGYKYDKNLPE